MQLPEITIANQSLLKTGFRNASQVEVFSAVFSAVSSMGGVVPVKLFRLVPWSIENVANLPEPFGNFHVRSNPHAFNLAKTHFVAAPVVEFRGLDVRVTRHPLGDVNVAAAFQIVRDANGPERMIAYGRLDARIPRPSAHHVPCIDARHGPLGELARPADGRAEQRPFLVSRDPCRRDIFIQIAQAYGGSPFR